MQKVLVIAYYWPPAGGPGVQRWLKFVKYLRDFTIEPVVYVPENPTYPIEDASLVNEIPEGIQVLRQPIFEPYGWAGFLSKKKTKRISSGIIETKNQSPLEQLMLWIRGNFFIPDARKYWVKPSVQFLSKIIEKEGVKTIITTGPPHSVHLIGMQLRQQYDLKWVADFRDPWTSIGYHKKLKLLPSSQKKHKQLEKKVLNTADIVIVTSATTKNEFKQLTPKPIHVITNGYDIDYDGSAVLDTKFSMAHIGSLLSGRDPSNLWRALQDIINENEDFKDDFELQLIGVVSKDVLDNIYAHGLASFIKKIDYLSHREAIERQQRAQVLLLIEINSEETKGIIPGKLFEYMAAQRPILGIGPKQWDVATIVAETQTGEVFDYEAQLALKQRILLWYENYKNASLKVNSKNVATYSRKALTQKLVNYL